MSTMTSFSSALFCWAVLFWCYYFVTVTSSSCPPSLSPSVAFLGSRGGGGEGGSYVDDDDGGVKMGTTLGMFVF